MVAQKSLSTHQKTFPFLKKLFFHKKTITSIRPSLLPTKRAASKGSLFYGKDFIGITY